MKTLELIDEQKNVFGDTIYYIRDGKGVTATVFEQDIDDYLRKKRGLFISKRTVLYLYKKVNANVQPLG